MAFDETNSTRNMLTDKPQMFKVHMDKPVI